MDNQHSPAAQHRELCSVLCDGLDRKGVWGEWIHAHVWLISFVVRLKLPQLH